MENYNFNNGYNLNNLDFGIYSFKFKSDENNKFYDVKQKIFVVNHDYELLNINDLNNKCIYYDANERVLFSALTINETYIS